MPLSRPEGKTCGTRANAQKSGAAAIFPLARYPVLFSIRPMNLAKLPSRQRRRAIGLVQTIVVVGLAALIIVLAAGAVRAGFDLHRDRAIRENLQSIWIAAVQYSTSTGATEVTFEELKKPNPLVNDVDGLRRVAGEDYSKVNNGKIALNARELVLEYTVGKKTYTATYPTR
jgi:hypothetical protein